MVVMNWALLGVGAALQSALQVGGMPVAGVQAGQSAVSAPPAVAEPQEGTPEGTPTPGQAQGEPSQNDAMQDGGDGTVAPVAEAVASAVVHRPLVVNSPDGALRAVLVGAHINADVARTTHALVAQRGQLVQWVSLPFSDLPDAAVAPDSKTIHCLLRTAAGDDVIDSIDPATGLSIGRIAVDPMLPMGAKRDRSMAVTVGYRGTAPCLAFPMACGTLALVEFDAGEYEVCSFIRPTRLVCGADAWLEQARALASQGDCDAALYALETAIESDPADPRCYRELANFHGRQGDSTAKLVSLELGMERLFEGAGGAVTGSWRVGTPEARLALEYVAASKDIDGVPGAHQALDRAMSLYPCMAQAVFLRAELLFEADRPEEALLAIQGAVAQLDPNADLSDAYHDVGRFLIKHDRRIEALRYLEDAYALGERSEFLFRSLATICEEEGERERAATWLSELAKMWRSIHNGESEPGRNARGEARLAKLDAEIAALLTAPAEIERQPEEGPEEEPGPDQE